MPPRKPTLGEQGQRLVVLDLLIARTKLMRQHQKRDLKKLKSYKGDATEARVLLKTMDKTLTDAKKERKLLIAKLLRLEEGT